MERECVLRVEGINKQFPGTKALTDMRVDLYAGEVLALVGENGAGKSTLMNIISGVLTADSGTIWLGGEKMAFLSPKDAQDAGIGLVHQELSVCKNLTVAENVFMGSLERFKNKLGLINYTKLEQETQKFLDRFRSQIRPNQKMRDLKVADQQIVEIIKSWVLDCKVIIFDEPTSSLTEKETETLFEMIDSLKKENIGVIYISHRMEEIFKLCDRITIMRDGHYIDTVNTADVTAQDIVCSMVGRTIENLYPEKSKKTGEIILECRGLGIDKLFYDIDFEIRKGEILGFAGLVGSGRTEVACGVCGLLELGKGEIFLEGKQVKLKDYSQAVSKGIAYLTEDRKEQGLFLKMDVGKNISVTALKKNTRKGMLNEEAERKSAEEFAKMLGIKISGIKQKVGKLSGGNQQKVMLAKWLNIEPKVIILDEPTRGIDVGAKSEIHNILRDLANSGVAVMVISSELPEIIGLCDRVVVMHEGKVTGKLTKEELTEERIMALATAI